MDAEPAAPFLEGTSNSLDSTLFGESGSGITALGDQSQSRRARQVETLKGTVASMRLRVNSAEAATKQAEAERLRLIDQVVALEADRRNLQQEAERWRRKCLELEQECTALSVREDGAQVQLREAHTRERQLAVKSIESRLAAAYAENEQMQAQSQARAYNWDAQRLLRELEAKVAELEKMRGELEEDRTQIEKLRAALELVTKDREAIVAEREEQREALVEAAKRHGALEARVYDLEGLLNASHRKQTDFMEEVQSGRLKCHRLEEANSRLRVDLQEAIAQAVRGGEKPFYSAGRGKVEDLPGLFTSSGALKLSANESVSPRSPASDPVSLRSPKSRLDYPKSAHARQLRGKVLSARGEALDTIDRLSQPMQI